MISLGGEEFDFGSISPESTAEARFDFKNETERRVSVMVSVTCGCTQALVHYKGALLSGFVPPGEEFVVTVKYDTSRIGPFEKEAQVDTYDDFNMIEGRIIVKLKGVVE